MGAEYGVTPRPHNGPSPARRRPQRVVREGRCAARPGGYNAGPFIPPPGSHGPAAPSAKDRRPSETGAAAPAGPSWRGARPCGPASAARHRHAAGGSRGPGRRSGRGHHAGRIDPGPGLRRLGQRGPLRARQHPVSSGQAKPAPHPSLSDLLGLAAGCEPSAAEPAAPPPGAVTGLGQDAGPCRGPCASPKPSRPTARPTLRLKIDPAIAARLATAASHHLR